ncbi:MAG: serine/threonine protein kinase, partial [Myxococcales bacterium]|nr:serine/threonine protein kinase [Myxococcales bacterium]
MGAADRPTPDRDFGPYRLVHRIASGGMAEVFLAKIRGLGDFEKFVAIKTIHANLSEDPSFVQMLIDEAKISVQLQHGNIAQTFDLGRVGETYYITMEFVDGCDLFKLLRVASEKNEPTPLAVAAWVAKEFATGLDYAHRKRGENGEPLGIVHRDVSPQNVLLSHSGEVKIADFGIAKAAQRAVHTAVGTIKGKYYYMSPEQAWGDPVDHRTDVFSAGIVLHEMLCGQMLYLEDDLRRLLDMVRKAEIAPPSSRRRDVPPDLDRIVMRALARRPEARFQSAQDLATALERWLHLHAPDYTPTRLCSFMRQILDPAEVVAAAPAAALRAPAVQVPAPRAPERPAPRAPAPRSSASSVSREAIARSRTEFDDENSVILDLAQVSRTRNPATDRHG